MTLIDKACFERGCACYDDRVDDDAVEVVLAQTQEPFAWAEFDGEGGYFLRLYENNETYAEDWNKRNPNHIGWVEPIYKYPPQRTWVDLTDEEENKYNYLGPDMYWVIQEIKAKLKELNT
jgi:hypothetical protein